MIWYTREMGGPRSANGASGTNGQSGAIDAASWINQFVGNLSPQSIVLVVGIIVGVFVVGMLGLWIWMAASRRFKYVNLAFAVVALVVAVPTINVVIAPLGMRIEIPGPDWLVVLVAAIFIVGLLWLQWQFQAEESGEQFTADFQNVYGEFEKGNINVKQIASQHGLPERRVTGMIFCLLFVEKRRGK
jgi:hypothetical protein